MTLSNSVNGIYGFSSEDVDSVVNCDAKCQSTDVRAERPLEVIHLTATGRSCS